MYDQGVYKGWMPLCPDRVAEHKRDLVNFLRTPPSSGATICQQGFRRQNNKVSVQTHCAQLHIAYSHISQYLAALLYLDPSEFLVLASRPAVASVAERVSTHRVPLDRAAQLHEGASILNSRCSARTCR